MFDASKALEKGGSWTNARRDMSEKPEKRPELRAAKRRARKRYGHDANGLRDLGRWHCDGHFVRVELDSKDFQAKLPAGELLFVDGRQF